MNFLKKNSKLLWWAGLFLYLSVALLNVGIIATDDYEFGISRIIPAQNWDFASISVASGVRNPFQAMFLFVFTKTALVLGFIDPIHQLKFALCLVALMTYLLNTYFAKRLFHDLGKGNYAVVAQFLLAFFFLCPLIFTRPLIETMSSPFVTGAIVFSCLYFMKGRHRDMAISIILLAIGGMFRYQVGIVGVGLVLCLFMRRDFLGIMKLVSLAAVLYVATGLIDWAYKGSLHASFFTYTAYQISEISKFGKQPFYVFIALFLGLSFPPVLISKYKGFNWKEEYTFLLPALFSFVAFVFFHSLITHKEERFMVPVFPIFMILVTPLVHYLLVTSGNQWRFNYFLVLNFLLLPLASYNVPQNNLIGVARYVQQQGNIAKIIDVGETLFNFPKAFIVRGIEIPSLKIADVLNETPVDCRQLFALRSDVREQIPLITNRFNKVAEFHPGLLERLVIKLNPRQNKRRGPIELYSPLGCPAREELRQATGLQLWQRVQVQDQQVFRLH